MTNAAFEPSPPVEPLRKPLVEIKNIKSFNRSEFMLETSESDKFYYYRRMNVLEIFPSKSKNSVELMKIIEREFGPPNKRSPFGGNVTYLGSAAGKIYSFMAKQEKSKEFQSRRIKKLMFITALFLSCAVLTAYLFL